MNHPVYFKLTCNIKLISDNNLHTNYFLSNCWTFMYQSTTLYIHFEILIWFCFQRVGPSYRSGPAFCPTINATQSSEILVASGIKKSIRVKVHIIGQFIMQTRFVCQFNIEGRVTSVNAYFIADTIYCDSMEFSYTSRAPNITATFAVIWGGSKPLDNPDNIHSKYGQFVSLEQS